MGQPSITYIWSSWKDFSLHLSQSKRIFQVSAMGKALALSILSSPKNKWNNNPLKLRRRPANQRQNPALKPPSPARHPHSATKPTSIQQLTNTLVQSGKQNEKDINKGNWWNRWVIVFRHRHRSIHKNTRIQEHFAVQNKKAILFRIWS